MLNRRFTQTGQLPASTIGRPNRKHCKQLLKQRHFISRDDWIQLQKHLIKNSFKSKTHRLSLMQELICSFVKPFPLY